MAITRRWIKSRRSANRVVWDLKTAASGTTRFPSRRCRWLLTLTASSVSTALGPQGGISPCTVQDTPTLTKTFSDTSRSESDTTWSSALSHITCLTIPRGIGPPTNGGVRITAGEAARQATRAVPRSCRLRTLGATGPLSLDCGWHSDPGYAGCRISSGVWLAYVTGVSPRAYARFIFYALCGSTARHPTRASCQDRQSSVKPIP